MYGHQPGICALGTAAEDARLKVLNDAKILDTPKDTVLDELTARAKRQFDVEIAVVSLVAKDRQWFKSRQGLDAAQTPRDVAFCDYTVTCQDVFIIPDARADERFKNNPLVTGHPFIRFYAGAPISVLGQNIGSFCVISSQPREVLTIHARGQLRGFAAAAAKRIEEGMAKSLGAAA